MCLDNLDVHNQPFTYVSQVSLRNARYLWCIGRLHPMRSTWDVCPHTYTHAVCEQYLHIYVHAAFTYIRVDSGYIYICVCVSAAFTYVCTAFTYILYIYICVCDLRVIFSSEVLSPSIRKQSRVLYFYQNASDTSLCLSIYHFLGSPSMYTLYHPHLA